MATYLRLKSKRKLVQWFAWMRPEVERVLGFRVTSGDYTTLAFLFEEIFVNREYQFATDHGRPCIVDAGSNIGMSVLFFKKLYPESRIVAFEPDEEAFALLRQNIELNALENVELHHAALATTAGTRRLFYDPQHAASLRMSLDEHRTTLACKQVVTVRLSDYLPDRVDFLKLDVEGAELDVLEELADSRGLHKIHKMVVEYHHHITERDDRFSRLLALLELNGFGYALRTATPMPFREGEFQDVLVFAYRH